VLVVAAVRLWSPLVVLAAALLGAVGAVAFVAVTTFGETCGTSSLAQGVETAGGLALGGGAPAAGTVTSTARDARERVPARPSARTL